MTDDPIKEKVDGQIRQFGGRFENYLVIVKEEKSKKLFWKANDTTWAIGAATRYLQSAEEMDRIDEREQTEGD